MSAKLSPFITLPAAIAIHICMSFVMLGLLWLLSLTYVAARTLLAATVGYEDKSPKIEKNYQIVFLINKKYPNYLRFQMQPVPNNSMDFLTVNQPPTVHVICCPLMLLSAFVSPLLL
jgi:hypothetical protein